MKINAEERKEHKKYVEMDPVVYPAAAGFNVSGVSKIHYSQDNRHYQKLIILGYNLRP